METKTDVKDADATPQARGKRLRVVRMMTGLPRKGFEEKYGISASTIQSWEAAKAGGLTKRGVARILTVLKQEGIFCTPDWLLYGVGAPPQPTGMRLPQVREEAPTHQMAEEEVIMQELLAFRSLNPDAVDMTVADDGMAPHFKKGDCIAGKVRIKDAIREVVGLDCIVQTADNRILFRRVKKSTQPNRYDLICTNPNTTVTNFVLIGEELISAAPVVWHRSRDTNK